MSQYRVGENRIYEGEWWFSCTPATCQGFLVEYSLNNYEDFADNFLYSMPIHRNESCHLCGNGLEWCGYSGGSPISDSLVSLLQNGHFMASTVILSATLENSLRNLLWAALVDNGVEQRRANKVADGRLNRIDTINIIVALTDLPVRDIAFPARNLVAHGKGLTLSETLYKDELKKQIGEIRKWVSQILNGKCLSNFMPSESERWLLFMDHWSNWLVSYVDLKLLKEE